MSSRQTHEQPNDATRLMTLYSGSRIRGDLDSIGCIPGLVNDADGLTKETSKHERLKGMMIPNRIALKPIGWARMTCEKKNERVSVMSDYGDAIRALKQNEDKNGGKLLKTMVTIENIILEQKTTAPSGLHKFEINGVYSEHVGI